MDLVSIAEVRARFLDLVHERSLNDFRLLEELEDMVDILEADEEKREIKKRGAKSWKQVKKELGFL